MSTTYNATLSKKINGENVYVYPKTNSVLVKHGNTTVSEELTRLGNEDTKFKNITTVNSLSDMKDTNSLYIYQFYIYEYVNNAWVKKGHLPETPPTDTTLTESGAVADAKSAGDRITALETKVGSNTVSASIEGYIVTDLSTT